LLGPLYAGILGLIAVQRLAEMYLSQRNISSLRRRGGKELNPEQFKFMLFLHIAWFLSCAYEGLQTQVFLSIEVFAVAIVILVLCQAVRFLSMHELKDRWTTRIYVVPGEPLIETGIYRWWKHPNYFIVRIELALIPLLCGGWKTALVFSALNAVFLKFRIQAEDHALTMNSSSVQVEK
jgi:methyltransferase